MTTEHPETETVARLLARGYNRHIKDHGPDGDYAGEVTETSDGHGLIVSRDGAEFAVRVERAQAMTAPGPLTPGQCWAALRETMRRERIHQDEVGGGQGDLGHVEQSERAYGWVEALDHLLATMDQMEAGQ